MLCAKILVLPAKTWRRRLVAPVEEYIAQESGDEDLSFTFLYKCADKLGVDVIELLTGENRILRAIRSHA